MVILATYTLVFMCMCMCTNVFARKSVSLLECQRSYFSVCVFVSVCVCVSRETPWHVLGVRLMYLRVAVPQLSHGGTVLCEQWRVGPFVCRGVE